MSNTGQPLTESMFYILMVLHHPKHGYGIAQEIERISGGRLKMGAGTLYGALKNLMKNEWIRQVGSVQDSRGKKQYLITELGKEVYEAEIRRLKELLGNAERMKRDEEIQADLR